MDNKELIKIEGEIDAVIYNSEKDGYCVIMLKTEDDLVPVVGYLGIVEEGEELSCTGFYTTNRKYGEQFSCEVCERRLPSSAEAIRKYLASGSIKGVGKVTAKNIVDHFGEDTLNIMETEPERLCEVDGVSADKANKIASEFKKAFAVRSLMIFLNEYRIRMEAGISAYKKWGGNAEQLIRSNPYLLCSLEVELKFEAVDKVGAALELPYDCEERVSAGIKYKLAEVANDDGHTCLPQSELCRDTCRMLGIDSTVFDTVLTGLLEDEQLYCYIKKNVRYIMLPDFFAAENYISERLNVMKDCSYDTKMDFSGLIDKIEKSSGISYDEKQREAVNLALSYGFLVITGGPGTGKTTTLNAIIELYDRLNMNVMVAAPTGRAAKRLTDITGKDAKTIHRMLEVIPTSENVMKFSHNEKNKLDCDALIIDEMSMVDTRLFEAVLKAIRLNCKLVLVGDSDQLPSVGAGNVLKDIMDSDVMPVVRLTRIFRQAQQSAIVMNAHRIVGGEHIDLSLRDNDFFYMQRLDHESVKQLIAELCKTRLPKAYGYSPYDDIQVLSPMRKGLAGTLALNKLLQSELNPPAAGKTELTKDDTIYRTGDKVMQRKNDYEITWKRTVGQKTESGAGIFNGDIGRIISCNKNTKTVKVDFEGRMAEYTYDMLDDLELAYAITVHKSQGSEFEAVLLSISGVSAKLCYRNLLYTAVTRAKKLLVIIGDNEQVMRMIDNNFRMLRHTCLKEMLRELDRHEDENAEISWGDT